MQEFTCKYCGCVNELKTKSNRQNRYFRGVLVPHVKKAFERLGNFYTNDEIVQKIEKTFWTYEKYGEKFHHSTKNSKNNTEDWEDKMQEVRNWVYDTLDSYIIPLPNEMDINERD